MKRLVLILGSLALLAAEGAAAVIEFTGLDLSIPDGSSSGLVNSQTITPGQASGSITGLKVRLDIGGVAPGGAFNGDLYATLQHASGAFAVLLNRPGRTDADPWGYGDNGLSVTFDDSGAAPDIHTYQVTLGGSAGGPVTGVWGSDGRAVDPGVVTDAAPRLALLTDFAAIEASGRWTLFLADLDPGGQSRLDAWGLEFAFTPIPESPAFSLGASLGLGALLLFLGRSRRNA
ncbi:MAG: PEP-CTERM sorting domain-containing protein [Verrucomicrobiales bacterium]|nr:PEP-CTERM sorting domain-containing protein [Verrucomicrobiales bacterium]MCP5528138.1 PEP-CTERM sorting domain-containing protein [Verrucomicrobiales bacterium]